MRFHQEPKPIQKALMVAAKFGFLRKETFWKYLTTPNISYKYELWNKLMASGYFSAFNRLGVSENYFYLTKRGLRIINDIGFQPVTKVHPLYFEHDEIILNFALSCEAKGLIKDNWMTEKVARQLTSVDQIKYTGSVLDKIPDLIFEPSFKYQRLNCAFEVERTRKSKARYDNFVLSYNRQKSIGLVLIAYKDEYIKRSILESVKRLGYPQDQRPMVFSKISNVIASSSNFEMSLNSKKINFDEFIENMKMIDANLPEKSPEIHSGKNYGQSGIAA